MKKMVINHLDKVFVTSDAATIMKEVKKKKKKNLNFNRRIVVKQLNFFDYYNKRTVDKLKENF